MDPIEIIRLKARQIGVQRAYELSFRQFLRTYYDWRPAIIEVRHRRRKWR